MLKSSVKLVTHVKVFSNTVLICNCYFSVNKLQNMPHFSLISTAEYIRFYRKILPRNSGGSGAHNQYDNIP